MLLQTNASLCYLNFLFFNTKETRLGNNSTLYYWPYEDVRSKLKIFSLLEKLMNIRTHGENMFFDEKWLYIKGRIYFMLHRVVEMKAIV